jgi:MscS family membrane protein
VLLLVGPATPGAQTQPPPRAAVEAAPDSPRAAVKEYLDLCRTGDYESAARYLALRPPQREGGAERARRLKAVLDRHLWIDIEGLSPLAEGDESDRLPPGVDEIATVPLAGREVPVRILAPARPGAAKEKHHRPCCRES